MNVGSTSGFTSWASFLGPSSISEARTLHVLPLLPEYLQW